MAKKVTKKPPAKKTAAKPKLLSGGNPQIAKGDGDAPVQAFIAAAPGWKREACAEIDALITKALPKVQKAVKWNSPFYGVEPGHWMISYHCMTRYVKVAFFRGAELDPPPPEPSKQALVRYFHVGEGEEIDAKQFVKWVKQAAKLPGVKM